MIAARHRRPILWALIGLNVILWAGIVPARLVGVL